jgi:Holliday junction resolvase RusA-like endonuclease
MPVFEMIRLEFQIQQHPPSKKNSMVYGKKRAWKDEKLVKFEKELSEFAIQMMAIKHYELSSSPFQVIIEVGFPDKRRRDVHNCHAAVLDALEGVVWMDDKQVVDLRIYLNRDTRCSYTKLTINELRDSY